MAKKNSKKFDKAAYQQEKKDQSKALQQRICDLVNVIADQTDQAKASEAFQNWLKVQSQFHNYSYRNTMLILLQKPEATHVAGFHKWKDMGRFVKKGEKSISILAPCYFKKKVEVEKDDGTKENQEVKQMYFKTVPVFDISQTEGEELPTLNHRTAGDDNGLVSQLEAFIQKNSIQLEYVSADILEGANGCSMGKKILVLETLQGAERAATLTHEIAHELLHKDLEKQHSRSTKEIEAEGTAAVVLSALGFDMSKSSFYMASWEGSAEKVKESLQNITTASRSILEFLEGNSEQSQTTDQEMAA